MDNRARRAAEQGPTSCPNSRQTRRRQGDGHGFAQTRKYRSEQYDMDRREDLGNNVLSNRRPWSEPTNREGTVSGSSRNGHGSGRWTREDRHRSSHAKSPSLASTNLEEDIDDWGEPLQDEYREESYHPQADSEDDDFQGRQDFRHAMGRGIQSQSRTSTESSQRPCSYNQIKGSLIAKERPKPRTPPSSTTSLSLNSRRLKKGTAWSGPTDKEKTRIDRSIKMLSLVSWGLEDAENPRVLPRRNLEDHGDHVRLLRPVLVDGMSISVVYNRRRPFLFNGTMNRQLPSDPNYFEVLSTKAFLLLLLHYIGRGHMCNVIVPQSYIDNFLKDPLIDDPKAFEELLDSGLISGCDSFEHLLQIVDEREACLVMDLAEFHRFYKNLPWRVKDYIGFPDRGGKKKSADYVDLSNRFVQPYFVGPERRPILPADNSISYQYSWMDDRMSQNSLVHSALYKKLYQQQMSFYEQIRWLLLCDDLLKTDRQLTERKRFDLLMEKYERHKEEQNR